MHRLAELADVHPDVGHGVPLYATADHAVYWVGISDMTAFRCNVYFTTDGDEGIIVDPGSRDHFADVKHHVGEIMDPAAVSGMILCHQVPDVAASMVDWLEVKPDMRVFTSPRTNVLLPHHGVDGYRFYDTTEEPEYRLPSGAGLRFIDAPFLHFPGAITTSVSRFLLSGDILAALDLDWTLVVDDFAGHITKMDLFHMDYMDYMDYNLAARGFVPRLDGLEFDGILPQHGSIIRKEHVPLALDDLENLQCGLDIIYAGLDD